MTFIVTKNLGIASAEPLGQQVQRTDFASGTVTPYAPRALVAWLLWVSALAGSGPCGYRPMRVSVRFKHIAKVGHTFRIRYRTERGYF